MNIPRTDHLPTADQFLLAQPYLEWVSLHAAYAVKRRDDTTYRGAVMDELAKGVAVLGFDLVPRDAGNDMSART